MNVDLHGLVHGKKRVVHGILAAAIAFLPTGSDARSPTDGFDPFGTQHEITAPPVVARVPESPGRAPCESDLPSAALRLDDVAARALCRNPLTRRAWGNALAQAARLGEAKAAQWPTLSGVVNGSLNRANTASTNEWASHESYNGAARAAELAFEWVVFDFGARSAEVRKARELLIAADQSFNGAVLDVLYTSAHDYFAAMTARAQAEAAHEAEVNAAQSLAAAHGRMLSGVASIADELQARTAHNQAMLNVVKATSALHEAIGTLAIDMGLSPDVPIVLSAVPAQIQRTAPQLETIKVLLDQALDNHPRLLAARAELHATEASIESMRAQAWPTVRLQAGLSDSNRPTVSIGAAGGASSTSRSSYVGVRVTIPFFEGFGSTYRIREARAQAELQQANVAEAEQQVALNVWKSYEAVRAGAQTVQQAEALQENAALAFDAAQARYRIGVANIIELLHAQDALVAANHQRIATLADWYVARLSLAASLGKLNLGQIQSG
ncbi:TolC family protein [Paraburkholderia sp. RL17-337-BIB-A]|uniref:TolC family protein n=1 Tax=Paraburkholderia sp. RL17-337-BIB-A TaxID=3031636 RepID=UPI0038B72458